MDLKTVDTWLLRGHKFEVTYRYPSTVRDASGSVYEVRTDKLLDVSPVRRKLFVAFKGRTPIWIESHEVIEIREAGPS